MLPRHNRCGIVSIRQKDDGGDDEEGTYFGENDLCFFFFFLRKKEKVRNSQFVRVYFSTASSFCTLSASELVPRIVH